MTFDGQDAELYVTNWSENKALCKVNTTVQWCPEWLCQSESCEHAMTKKHIAMHNNHFILGHFSYKTCPKFSL